MRWTQVINLNPAETQQPKVARIQGQKLCFWFKNGQWFAFDLKCPHEGYPLIQGDVDDKCVLTCRWHNWRFRLEDGHALRGADRLQTYPVKQEGDHLYVDVTPQPLDLQKRALINDMEGLFTKRYYGAMGRLWTKWHLKGFPPAEMHAAAIDWAETKWERGFNHGLASLIEWQTLSEQFQDPVKALSCQLEAMDFMAEDAFGQPNFPYTEDTLTFSSESFSQALEQENEDLAIAMLKGFLNSGGTFETLEPILVNYVFNHYLGYGHGAIYLAKIPRLLDYLGHAALPSLLQALTRYLIVATRDEVLPEFKRYPKVLDALTKAFGKEVQNEAYPSTPPVGISLKELWNWLIATSNHYQPKAIMDVLLELAAKNLLHFNTESLTKANLKPKDEFSWLSLSHAITFAEASLKHMERFPFVAAAALTQMAAFIGRVQPSIDPQINSEQWYVTQPAEFNDWAKNHILLSGETENIYPAHWLKTYLAIQTLEPKLQEQTVQHLWAGLNRYMHSRAPKKHPTRTIHQAMDLLAT